MSRCHESPIPNTCHILHNTLRQRNCRVYLFLQYRTRISRWSIASSSRAPICTRSRLCLEHTRCCALVKDPAADCKHNTMGHISVLSHTRACLSALSRTRATCRRTRRISDMRTSSAVFCRCDFLKLAKTGIKLLGLHGPSQDIKGDSLPPIAAPETSIASSVTCLGYRSSGSSYPRSGPASPMRMGSSRL